MKDGIRVNCVCPGTTQTPWIDERLREARRSGGRPSRAGGPPAHGPPWPAEEMAAAYLFLASDESAFTTGTALVVDGGFLA